MSDVDFSDRPGREGWYLTTRDAVLWFDGADWWQVAHSLSTSAQRVKVLAPVGVRARLVEEGADR